MTNPIIEALLSGDTSDSPEGCSCGNCKDPMDMTKEQAEALVPEMAFNLHDLKVGDRVVRSAVGKEHIRFPLEDSNQIAVISQICDGYQIDQSNDEVYNAFVTIAVAEGVVRTYPTSLRSYVKA